MMCCSLCSDPWVATTTVLPETPQNYRRDEAGRDLGTPILYFCHDCEREGATPETFQ